MASSPRAGGGCLGTGSDASAQTGPVLRPSKTSVEAVPFASRPAQANPRPTKFTEPLDAVFCSSFATR